ncbi:hypothetical protein BKA65DRAFT_480455 [Rhexocercosporidium sp. MPI-PUGE-AT-0058]|nr:hypothetical protein BKA65DRAFT_480455 [Rhexocercosporidium sp. MPI-PUGE-AT-0058]
MQYSSLLLTVLAAGIVSAQSGTQSSAATRPTGGSNSTSSGRASGTGTGTSPPRATGTTRGNSTNTTTGAPIQVSGNSAQSLMSQGGGLVTIAGLSVAFAVFM